MQQAYGHPQGKVHLYKSKSESFIEEFNISFIGQFQGGAVKANQGAYDGSHHSTTEWRRFRLGGNIKFLKRFRIVNSWDIGGLDTNGYQQNGIWQDHGTSRGKLYEAILEYSHKDEFRISAGKIYPRFFAENRKSSSAYIAPEAPSLECQFVSKSAFGVHAGNEHTEHDFKWNTGVWSNTEERSRGTWGTWQSASAFAGVSLKADRLLLNSGRVHLDWIHSWQDQEAIATSRFRDTYIGTPARDVFSLYYIGKHDRHGLVLEAIWAERLASYQRSGQIVNPNHVAGLIGITTYDFTTHFQGVFRLQWSKGNDGVKLHNRYASLVPTQGSYVDENRAVGLGVNLFIYPEQPNRLKISLLAEYSNSERKHATGGFTGWTFLGGLYTSF